MGRLDDHAKKRIVELRKAGLSFRKIKKVLELDNIRVTPQAVYLFLKRKNVEPTPTLPVSHPQATLEKGSQKTDLDQAAWDGDQLWNLLQENESGQNKQREPSSNQLLGPSVALGARCDMPPCSSKEDGIRIVSVTSLSKDGGQYGKQNIMPGGISVGLSLGPSIGKVFSWCSQCNPNPRVLNLNINIKPCNPVQNLCRYAASLLLTVS